MKNFTPHASRLTLGIVLLSFNLLAQSPCGLEMTPADWQEAQQFENSINIVAGGLATEALIPIRIIYVYEDNGETIGHAWRVSEQIGNANQTFDDFMNFYICGYHHISSSDYTHYNHPANWQGLYDTYHDDNAINVYVVRTITTLNGTSGGLGSFPFGAQPNNMIWLTYASSSYTLAHELGHYFGLLHTHATPYLGPDNCFLKNPVTEDTDNVPDTPVDPGPLLGTLFGLCQQECPIATTPCTLTCNENTPPVTYTYAGYYTNNVMSYYNCPPKELTTGQIARMSIYQNHPTRTFLLNAQPACNNNIAEDGYINKYCNSSSPMLDVLPIKDLQIDLHNDMTGWHQFKSTQNGGNYIAYQNDFSNLVYATLKPRNSHPNAWMLLDDPTAVPPNYQPLNGVTTNDILLISRHILGIQTLPKPYAWIAADANNSGSITTFDIVTIRKLILGLTYDFPIGTWRYVPEHYFDNSSFESAFLNNPFSANYTSLGYPTYMDQITLDMDDASVAEEETWSFRAIKVGDVNCTMNVDEFAPDEGDALIMMYSVGTNCAIMGDVITLEVKATSIDALLGYQLGMSYNRNSLQFLGVSSGNLPDFSQDNFAPTEGQIRALWYKNNGQAEAMTSQKTLFKFHFRVLNSFCNIADVFALNDEVLVNAAYNESGESTSANITISYQTQQLTGTLASAYPNPVNNSVSFNFQVNQSSTVEIGLSDYLGNVLIHTAEYLVGTHIHTFSNLNTLADGSLNYWVKIGNLNYSGILVKSQE